MIVWVALRGALPAGAIPGHSSTKCSDAPVIFCPYICKDESLGRCSSMFAIIYSPTNQCLPLFTGQHRSLSNNRGRQVVLCNWYEPPCQNADSIIGMSSCLNARKLHIWAAVTLETFGGKCQVPVEAQCAAIQLNWAALLRFQLILRCNCRNFTPMLLNLTSGEQNFRGFIWSYSLHFSVSLRWIIGVQSPQNLEELHRPKPFLCISWSLNLKDSLALSW